MLSLGATTFWEDFNIDWLPDASRIDELVPPVKKIFMVITVPSVIKVSGIAYAMAGRQGQRPG